MEKGFLSQVIKGNRLIWFAVFVLMVIGCIEVYSCTTSISYQYQGGNTFFYPLKHLAFLVAGLVCMCVFSMISYKRYVKHANFLFLVGVILLIITLLTGNSTNDARRWLTIPFVGLSFQTSDVVKLFLVLYLSKMLALAQVEPENQKKYFFYCIGAIFGVCVFVLPSNFSTALMIGISSLVMLMLVDIPRKWILSVIAIAIVAFVLFVLFTKAVNLHTRFDTWVSRVETFFAGGGAQSSDYQSEQSLVAIGLGGFSGVGIGAGVQNTSLPHPYSDFIFATICHETGIVGAAVLCFCYVVLFFQFVVVVKKAKTLFPALLVVGLSLNIMLQTLANMLVATDFIPVTGQPLPFVSMGGSSIICTGVAIGVILNVSRYTSEKETVEEIEKNNPQEEEIVDYPFMAG